MQGDAAARDRMVARQIEARGIRSPRLLAAMRTVPRHLFLPEEERPYAYDDCPLPIGAGQTISQPYIVALMIDAAEIDAGASVLEVGAGSGYAAAVMGQLATLVHALERRAPLAAEAAGRIADLHLGNVDIVTADGLSGWPAAAPYDAIIVSAAGTHVPSSLLYQLKIGGRLVMPVAQPGDGQALMLYRRMGKGDFSAHGLCDVRFVPLLSGVDPGLADDIA